MPWTRSQHGEILEAAWAGNANCPSDATELEIRLAVRMDGDYRLQASCPRCRRRVVLARRDDPSRAAFRPWTDAEITALIDAVLQGQVAECPVCGTGVATDEQAVSRGCTVAFQCVRCGNVGARRMQSVR